MNRSKSTELFQRAQQFIPGGVNSPVRAFKSVGGDPIFFQSAKGAMLKDADGNEYIDYIGSWGPMILGHAFPKAIEAVQKAAEKSMSFGAPTEKEIEVAELITQMVPNVEVVRMVNSGTEACMSAIRVARGYTRRDKIIKFEGCYHGHGDSFLIKAGSGASTLGIPNSPGVTAGTAKDTLTATYNDLDNVQEIVDANRREIAAIIIEPVAGNMGCIPPEPGFLEGLRKICDDESIVLIFDEVMTGFRLAAGGAQEVYNIEADLITFGKVIGGGMPVGAYGGRKEIMDWVAPVGPVYQAGTLSGNPVAMACGYATLKELHNNPSIYSGLEEKGAYLEKGLHELLKGQTDYQINRVGSMISVHFTPYKVVDFGGAKHGDNEQFKNFFHTMLDEGVYLPPSAYETWFISNVHTTEVLDKTLEAAKNALEKMKVVNS